MAIITRTSNKDCKAIADIYNHYLGISTMDTEPKNESYYINIKNHQDEMEELWSLKQDGILVTWGIIKKYSDREGYRLTGETSVYCHPDHLNKGYGTQMKKHLMERCKRLGYHHLIARINSEKNI